MSLQVISALCQEASGARHVLQNTNVQMCRRGVATEAGSLSCSVDVGRLSPARGPPCLASSSAPAPGSYCAALCLAPKRKSSPRPRVASFCLLPPGGLSSTSPVLTDPITVRYYRLIVSIFLFFLSSLPMCRGFEACFISSVMKSATF